MSYDCSPRIVAINSGVLFCSQTFFLKKKKNYFKGLSSIVIFEWRKKKKILVVPTPTIRQIVKSKAMSHKTILFISFSNLHLFEGALLLFSIDFVS